MNSYIVYNIYMMIVEYQTSLQSAYYPMTLRLGRPASWPVEISLPLDGF